MAAFKPTADAAPLLGEGKLVVNLDTGKPNGFFQGIVPLTSSKLDDCLESYFAQSEQLADAARAAQPRATRRGVAAASAAGAWPRTSRRCVRGGGGRAATVSVDELTSLAARGAVAEAVRGSSDSPVRGAARAHDCRCTPERLAGVVRMLGEDEVKTLLAEQGHVELKCEFCNRAFRYDDAQVDAIMRGTPQASSAVH